MPFACWIVHGSESRLSARSSNGVSVDPLSDILSLLNAKSLLSAGLHAGGDWAVEFSTYQGVKFCVVVRGSCWLAVSGVAGQTRLEAGDCFFANGQTFVLASDLRLPPVSSHSVFTRAVNGIAHCGDVTDLIAIGGRVQLDEDNAALLLDALPPLIHIRGKSEEAGVLRWVLDRISLEVTSGQPGTALMRDNLAHIMFVQTLRTYLASEERPPAGWLGALADSRIGEAIRLLHANPSRHWTLDELSSSVAMSRSNFALRFKALVGIAPLDYLLRWRMRLAARELGRATRSVSSIALSLGYESESAFSKAFKRIMGSSPIRYRQNGSSLP